MSCVESPYSIDVILYGDSYGQIQALFIRTTRIHSRLVGGLDPRRPLGANCQRCGGPVELVRALVSLFRTRRGSLSSAYADQDSILRGHNRRIFQLHYDICFRWLCGGGDKPNFRTLSDFRKNNMDLLPGVFRCIVEVAINLGYATLGHVSVDGSKFKANASKHKAMSRERMKQELERIESEFGEALQAAQVADGQEGDVAQDPEDELVYVANRREKIRAALAELEARKPDDGSPASGKNQINCTDSDSRIMDTKNQGVIQGFNPQIAVDSDNGFIVGVVMSNSPNDQKQLDAVLDSVQANTDRNPDKMTADAGYFSAANIGSCQTRAIDAYIAATREGKQTGNSFDKRDFTYQSENDVYVCPNAKVLTLKQTQNVQNPEKPTKWVYECQVCPECPFQKECAKAKSGLRTITRSENDPVREEMRTKVQSERGRKSIECVRRLSNRCGGRSNKCRDFGSSFCVGQRRWQVNFFWLPSDTTFESYTR